LFPGWSKASDAVIDSLFQYNDWATAKLLELARKLSDEQLDSPRALGLGSLRATLVHILFAEQIWLERWQKKPWRVFQTDSGGMSLAELTDGLAQVSAERRQVIQAGRSEVWKERITYLDSKQNEYTNSLAEMLLHVANHGVHHRAQALHYLKSFDQKLPGGLDYLFFRIAYPTTELIAESVEPLRQLGLEVASGQGQPVEFHSDLLRDYYSYHDWANSQLLQIASSLDSATLQRDFAMGPGTIHKTLSHLRNAERWWLSIWSNSADSFPKYDQAESLELIQQTWNGIAQHRNEIVQSLDANSAQRIVVAQTPKFKMPLRVIESMTQLCCHGTHHRAQLINMLRQVGIQTPALDYIVWLRQRG
jgi:uncharacterized damage-inducible protein DinB